MSTRWVVPQGRGESTFGELTNVEILALTDVEEGQSVFSTDDNIVYNFYNGSWYSTGGGVLS